MLPVRFFPFLAAVAALTPLAVAAQPIDISTFEDEEARGLYLAGTAAFDGGRFEEALGHFQRAYDLSHRPELLFNMGVAAERLRQDERALAAFEGYLRATPDAPNRPATEARMEVLRDAIASAQATADTETPSGGPGAAPWIVGGLSIAVAATGVALLGVAAGKKSSVESAMGVEWSTVSGDYDAAVTLSALGAVLLGVGAAGLVCSIVWLLVGGSGDESVAVSISPTGISIRGAF